jgi:hypothetical protein
MDKGSMIFMINYNYHKNYLVNKFFLKKLDYIILD